MDWEPDEEKFIQVLAEAYSKGDWDQQKQLLEKKLGIPPERRRVIVRLLYERGLLADICALRPTAESVSEWRRIEADRRNWYKRARNWCETHWVTAIILAVAAAYGVVKTLVEMGQFVWNLFHLNVPPTP